MDVSTTSSKETNNFNLPTNQSLATSVKNLADALPFIGLVRSPANGYSGVTCDDASTIPGILMKNHNSERRFGASCESSTLCQSTDIFIINAICDTVMFFALFIFLTMANFDVSLEFFLQ